jgi:hypothetical protein
MTRTRAAAVLLLALSLGPAAPACWAGPKLLGGTENIPRNGVTSGGQLSSATLSGASLVLDSAAAGRCSTPGSWT